MLTYSHPHTLTSHTHTLTQDDALVAYQIAFDLYESATQEFLRKVQDGIRGSIPAPPPAPTTTHTDGPPLETPVQESGELVCEYFRVCV